MSKAKVKIRIQGHEKFVIREGWITKGLAALEKDSHSFSDKYATDIFGIGSNMVKSLRYWLRAFGLTEEKGSKGTYLTTCGSIINEYDKYLEDSFTLWVLHSNIVRNIDNATTWYMYFNKCDANELSKEQITKVLYREIYKYVNGQTFSELSLKNDIDIMLSMYSRDKNIGDPEDKNNSPFSTLRLVKSIDGKYTKQSPDLNEISEWNILYELAKLMEGMNSISIDTAIYGNNGISNIYQLNSVVINEYLDKLEALGYIRVTRTAGLDTIYRETDFTIETVMKEYYRRYK